MNTFYKYTVLAGTAGVLLASVSSVALAAPLPSLGSAQPSTGYMVVADDASAGAKAFIDTVANRGVGFLSNNKMSLAEQRQSFRGLLRDSFDLNTIGRFALGHYWRAATPAQRSEYQRLFETMVVEVYSDRFSSYNGQQMKTGAVKVVSDTDAVVSSQILGSGEPVNVDWRVRKTGGKYKVVDIVVEGVSMAVTQRSEFASVIGNGGGDVDVLLNHMRNPKKK